MSNQEEIQHLKELLTGLRRYVGYASCAGNKCRLPHCHDCGTWDEKIFMDECDKLDALQTEISKALA